MLLWAGFLLGCVFGVAARLGRFCLLRGLPFDRHGAAAAEAALLALGEQLGKPLNGQGSPVTRLTGRPTETEAMRSGLPRFHIEACDAIALLCLASTPDAPPHGLVSAGAVHNEVMRRDRAALAVFVHIGAIAFVQLTRHHRGAEADWTDAQGTRPLRLGKGLGVIGLQLDGQPQQGGPFEQQGGIGDHHQLVGPILLGYLQHQIRAYSGGLTRGNGETTTAHQLPAPSIWM